MEVLNEVTALNFEKKKKKKRRRKEVWIFTLTKFQRKKVCLTKT